jgi:hypothetical protein
MGGDGLRRLLGSLAQGVAPAAVALVQDVPSRRLAAPIIGKWVRGLSPGVTRSGKAFPVALTCVDFIEANAQVVPTGGEMNGKEGPDDGKQ